MKFRILTLAAAALMFAVPSIAAAQNAVATGNVNVRVGPGTQHPVIGTLPAGAPVTVRGCVRGYSWCDTQYGGLRGWVSGNYLAGNGGYRGRTFVDVAPALGIGIIAGTIFGGIDHHSGYESRRYNRHSNWESRRYYDRHSGRESRRYNRHSDRESRRYNRHSDRESRRYSHSSRESRRNFSNDDRRYRPDRSNRRRENINRHTEWDSRRSR